MTIELTQIESDVFDFIASNQEILSPTYKTIAEGVGLGRVGNAFVVVQRLVEKGFVKVGSGARNITLVDHGKVTVSVSVDVHEIVERAANARGQDIGTYIEDALMAVAGADLF